MKKLAPYLRDTEDFIQILILHFPWKWKASSEWWFWTIWEKHSGTLKYLKKQLFLVYQPE